MKMMLLPLLKGLTGITIFQLPTTYYLPSSGWREKISKIEKIMIIVLIGPFDERGQRVLAASGRLRDHGHRMPF